MGVCTELWNEVDEDESEGEVEGDVEGEDESEEVEVEDVNKDGLRRVAMTDVDTDVASRRCEGEEGEAGFFESMCQSSKARMAWKGDR